MNEVMTSEAVLENARELVPEIIDRGEEIATLRRLPRDLVDKLKAAGCYRIMFPKSFGGVEMPLLKQVELMEILAYADPSVSWVVKIGSDAGFLAALLEEDAAHELFPNVDMATAGQATLNGRATKVPGGYKINGRWSFGSGSTHADVMLGACIVEGEPPIAPGVPNAIFALAPASSWTIEDTWHSMGLCGSGSNHYSTTDLFVPDRHTFRGNAPASHAGSLFRLPFTSAVSVPWGGVPLGLMRRSIDEAIEVATTKIVPIPVRSVMKSLPRVRLAIARAEALLGAASAYVHQSVARLQDELDAGRDPSDTLMRAVGLSRIHAFRTAAKVSQMMVNAIGPSAILTSSPLDRMMRDAITTNQHLLLSDGIVEDIGAAIFGDAPNPPYL